jgi:hypothetical protein
MADWTAELDKLPMGDFSRLYGELVAGDTAVPKGVYKGTYVGPAWLKALAPHSMVVSGLGGWWGKDFFPGGKTYNLVQRDEEIRRVIPMQLAVINSRLDGAPALALIYDKQNPFPWPYIVDELRSLDEAALLGMMYLNVNALPKIAFPFLLQKVDMKLDPEATERTQRTQS